MELKDYLRILKRRAGTVILIALAITAANYFTLAKRAPRFQSYSQIILRDAPVPLVVTGDQGLMPIYEALSHDTRLSLITSEPVLGVTAFVAFRDHGQFKDVFKPAEEAPPPRPGREPFDVLTRGFAADKTKLSQAVDALRSMLSVVRVPNTEIVEIRAESDSPQWATVFAEAAARGFKEYVDLLSNKNVQDTLDLTQTRKTQMETELQGWQEKLTRYERARKVESPESRIERIEIERALRVPEMENALSLLDGEITRGAGTIAQLEYRLAHRAEALGPLDTPRLQSLRSAIDQAETDLGALLGRFTEESLQVQAKRRDLTRLRERLKTETEQERVHDGLRTLQDTARALQAARDEKVRLEGQLAKKREELTAARAEVERRMHQQAPGQPPVPEPLPAESESMVRYKINALENELGNLSKTQSDLQNYQTLKQEIVEVLVHAKPGRPLPASGGSSWPFGLLVGLLIGIGGAYFLEYINHTIRSEYDVRRYLNLQLLGSILKIRNEPERLLLNVGTRMPLSEVFNTMGALLESHASEHQSKIFMVASSRAEEGKSTVTANLGIALARTGERVILVDADLRKAVLHRFFGLENVGGLVGAVTGAAEDGLPAMETLLLPTSVENLKVIPAGAHPANPVTLLKSPRLKSLLQELRQRADIILIDVPPVNIAVDTMILAPMVDGIVMLMSAGEVTKEEVTHAKRLLESARGNLIGCILNKVTADVGGTYYYYYYNYKYYRQQ